MEKSELSQKIPIWCNNQDALIVANQIPRPVANDNLQADLVVNEANQLFPVLPNPVLNNPIGQVIRGNQHNLEDDLTDLPDQEITDAKTFFPAVNQALLDSTSNGNGIWLARSHDHCSQRKDLISS